jgi:hypothetical protein
LCRNVRVCLSILVTKELLVKVIGVRVVTVNILILLVARYVAVLILCYWVPKSGAATQVARFVSVW